jgi:hypothetical protein
LLRSRNGRERQHQCRNQIEHAPRRQHGRSAPGPLRTLSKFRKRINDELCNSTPTQIIELYARCKVTQVRVRKPIGTLVKFLPVQYYRERRVSSARYSALFSAPVLAFKNLDARTNTPQLCQKQLTL